MRDEGLKLAIEAAGGVGALARGLGIRQPSVSSWAKIPADRVVAVEGITGVKREQLRPDLYLGGATRSGLQVLAKAEIDEIEAARSREYLMIASLLRSAPTAETLDTLGKLQGNETTLGMARIALAEAASRAVPADVADEFFSVFIGIGRGEVLPYGSFYLTGFLHERPLARLREDLARLGIERADGNFDPEDHLGLLMEIMGGFANGTFDAELTQQQMFFERHMAAWAERCLADIAVSPSARFYKAVAVYGMRFLEVEREAFAIGE
ncbi:unnamed protein product [Phaeothamnion confervicola]